MNASAKSSRLIWLASRAALLLVGIIWGSSLVVVKSSTELIQPNLLIACRFTLACLILSVVFFKKFKLLNKDYIISGAVIGACLFAAYWIQTLGVTLAMPGKSAFLSSIYCVLVPFVFWAIGGKKPSFKNLASAVLCVTGIVLSSVTSNFSILPGDLLALLSGLFFAIHIASIGKFGDGKDPVLITILQFGFCAAFAWIATFIFEGFSPKWDMAATGGVLYLAFACTALALLLQNVGQKYADPSSASILMSTESIFGVIFSVIFMGETLTEKLLLGFAFIFVSVLVSELQISPSKVKISKSSSHT